MTKINVLDKGYVRLVDCMGDDTTIVNAARVSYDKQTDELSDKDKRLIKFLATHEHTSPFRHATLQFEVYAPLMVARQWWKYVVGSNHTMEAWNESSRRYVTEEPEFYVPGSKSWRSAPNNSKQGSGKPVDDDLGMDALHRLMDTVFRGEQNYRWALENGICAEQARLFLPAYGMYVRWYWTASLQSVAHFINQRVESDAQKEIQEYAHAVKELALEKFPVSLSELIKP
ncbi:FAD-dependent thymidylate synthase [Pueribacillus theae]|uniref:FAD-dependent thymidylate synthase n=1 Tax=Pueribacillus theae TaxID=2171751 RepID=A0A2U1JTV7_9BACI|nr:FAD-dependent thymidylate synthase [Pueribacillus theae]PWA08636.1 FAD-dependent thymidylate synthase [Pueribacillus theae]